ncbi:MAG TPA: NrsF family protein [Rhizomicrobium sp.]|jgi:hypothetical protein
MKTDDLIAALAADDTPPRMPLRRTLASALALSVVLAALVWAMMLGPRPDFMTAMHTVRFVFKFVVALALAASAAAVLFPMALPLGRRSALRPLLWLAPGLLLAAVIAELATLPASVWMKVWMGHNAVVCMLSIPTIAAIPLAVMLFALREGAPARPARTGAIAGLVAGGIGAFFYAAHCFDDSPLFVATWYTIAIAFVSGAGALVGSRVLRW